MVMLQISSPDKKSLPLSVRLSLWLIGGAILPLLLALLISEVPSRATLISQASTLMTTDAKAHAKLIDNYLANKEAIIGSLTNDPTVQQYFLNHKVLPHAQLALFVQDGLALEKFLYPEISLIEFFTPRGESLLNYSIYGSRPQPHGATLVPAEYLQRVLRGQQFFSGVYYDPRTHVSTSELYTPTFVSATSPQVIGFVRDTLKLDSIWSIVKGEKDANGSGSYAFLLDQNGVRIVDPDPRTLFTAIAPPDAQAQQQIQDQRFYGLSSQSVPVVADKTLQSLQSQSKPPISFQEVPADQQDSFQVIRQQLTTVPWTYFTLTPVNVVEAVANQQLLILPSIALLVLIPLAVIGWIVGRRISFPVLRSVDALKRNSSALNELADREKMAASEQAWVIDASKVGLKSVEYYTQASQSAIRRLNDLGREVPQHEYEDTQIFLRNVESIAYIARYLEKAVDYQDMSNRKVSIAIGVTNEVAKQLASGARSTKEVADELDHVVKQLHQAVGRRSGR